jgi:mRNA interferase RelE/StbE
LPTVSRHKLRMPEDLANLVRGIHPGLKKKVKAALEIVLLDPASGKALRDDLAGLGSFKTGRLRIVYRVSKTEVQIVAIGPRGRIYEDTSRLVRQGTGCGQDKSSS